jgi:hypothetical protein
VVTSTIWISFDLGIRGDYEGLYLWLDSHEAKECGESLALLHYKYDGTLLSKLKGDLETALNIDKRTPVVSRGLERPFPPNGARWRGRCAGSVNGICDGL